MAAGAAERAGAETAARGAAADELVGTGGAGAAAEGAGAAAGADADAALAAGVGNLIAGAPVGLGGKLMRTVSFFGWTLAASAGLGGTAPVGKLGMFSAIFSKPHARVDNWWCQTFIHRFFARSKKMRALSQRKNTRFPPTGNRAFHRARTNPFGLPPAHSPFWLPRGGSLSPPSRPEYPYPSLSTNNADFDRQPKSYDRTKDLIHRQSAWRFVLTNSPRGIW